MYQIFNPNKAKNIGKKASDYLGDGEIQANVDDDHKEQQIKSSNHQHGFLQKLHAHEGVVDLKTECEVRLEVKQMPMDNKNG